tara:strand:- start:6011 stop:6130 length:120 start_codon:yes stop_codon:yes gene_type:complete
MKFIFIVLLFIFYLFLIDLFAFMSYIFDRGVDHPRRELL